MFLSLSCTQSANQRNTYLHAFITVLWQLFPNSKEEFFDMPLNSLETLIRENKLQYQCTWIFQYGFSLSSVCKSTPEDIARKPKSWKQFSQQCLFCKKSHMDQNFFLVSLPIPSQCFPPYQGNRTRDERYFQMTFSNKTQTVHRFWRLSKRTTTVGGYDCIGNEMVNKS